jgi:Zn-dependent peptidase ImmA (M78 family)
MLKKAIKAARDILEKFGVKLPIDIRAILKAHGITVHEEDLEGNVSGVLMIQEKQVDIIVNKNHIPGRQRYTLAHELAHYLLHKSQTNVFVDEMYRDAKSSYGIDQREIEANAFAAELLMPEELLRDEIAKKPLDANDDAAFRRMAAKYGVSPQALTFRLIKLGLITE